MVRRHHRHHRCCRRRCHYHHCRRGLHDRRGLSVYERDVQGEPVSTVNACGRATVRGDSRHTQTPRPAAYRRMAAGVVGGNMHISLLSGSRSTPSQCARDPEAAKRGHRLDASAVQNTSLWDKHTVRQQGDARSQAAVRKSHSTRGLECEFWAIHSQRRTCCIRSRPDALLHRPVMAMP
jgi:hypothetical protein